MSLPLPLPRHLQGRLAVVLIVVLIATGLSYGLILSSRHSQRSLQSLQQNAAILAQNMATNIAQRLVVDDFAGAEGQILQSAELPSIEHLVITAPDGQVLAEVEHISEMPPVALVESPPIEVPATLQRQMHHRGDHLELWEPIMAGFHLGWLRMHYSTAEIRAMERVTWLYTLTTALIWTLISVALVIIALRPVVRAFEQLTRFAGQLHENTGAQIALQGPTAEVSAMADSLNAASSELHAAGERLTAERQQLLVTLQSIADGVIAVDTRGRIQMINRAACELLACDERQAMDQAIDRVLIATPEARGIDPSTIGSILNRRQSLYVDNPQGFITQQGEVRQITFKASPMLLSDAEPQGVVIVLHDISAQLEFEAQLRQAQKMEAMGTLAGGIAHDFNNILTPIIGYGEIALGQLADAPDTPLRKELQEILRASGRARELVQQILSFSRKSDQRPRLLRPHTIIKEASKLLRATLPSTIDMVIDVSPNCPAMLADPTQIHQLMMNLGTNAYHAMRETGGTLRISLHPKRIHAGEAPRPNIEPGDYLSLVISDSGIGIPAEQLSHIFDPYFTTKAPGEGTGLGLAIVQGIVQSLGGSIEVNSRPQMGTTFELLFPALSETEQPVAPPTIEPARHGHEHILVVDDESSIAKVESLMLEKLGYRVTTHTDSQAALNHFQREAEIFDLVITDMTMPGLTGTELSQALLEIRPNMPIVMCSGFNDLIDEESAQRFGIRKYLAKPVSLALLSQTVRQVLDAP